MCVWVLHHGPVSRCRTANAGFVDLDAAGDPNNTRDWADINEPAQNNRNAPGGFKLAGGHMFGDNTEVLLPAA